jgi:hypothetical protein
LTFSSISAGEDFALANNCGQALAVDSSCNITVAFAPLSPGTIAGALSIVDNAPGSPQAVALSGTGLGPAASVSPEYLMFSDQLVETASSPLSLTLSNAGNRPLEISGITLSGDFIESNDCDTALAPGDFCNLEMAFAPVARGERTGALSISHNGLDSPTVVSLTGRGVAPVVSLSSPELQFGRQPVGTTSSPQIITLGNSGDAPLNILGIEATGDFAQTNDCPGSVAAGGECAIRVTFTPQVPGSRSGMLAITHNPTADSFTVSLSGMATDFSISASPESATIHAGETAAYSLALNPIAGFSGQLSLTCSGAPTGATCAVVPGKVSVNGPDSATAVVTVKTTARSLGPPGGPPEHGPGGFADHAGRNVKLLWLFSLAFLMLAGWGSARQRTRWSLAGALLSAALWAACGGGGSASPSAPKPGTPAGNYTLIVSATSGGISRNATFTLTVD